MYTNLQLFRIHAMDIVCLSDQEKLITGVGFRKPFVQIPK